MMTNDNKVQTFSFGMNELRLIIKHGEPWFAAKVACRVLEIKTPTMALKRLDSDEVTKFNLGGLEGANSSPPYASIIGLGLRS
ncbi:BRO-N domain-containing protein [Neobacillus massiliamazoniensis]|uniref:BRO-N domain-containing protein n=1 Tax=Neobacillus massiliamazoniensis TaxID=1499688 RepID=UPI001C3FFFAF|nr:BRO family protein [Neobacillus massiliamazoniensis]